MTQSASDLIKQTGASFPSLNVSAQDFNNIFHGGGLTTLQGGDPQVWANSATGKLQDTNPNTGGGGGGGGGGGYTPPAPSGYGTDPNFNYSGWGQNFGTGASGQAAYEGYRNNATSAINSGYDQYFAGLDKQLGLLPEQQKNLGDQVNNLVTGGQQSIGTQQANSLAQLGQSDTNIDTNKSDTLRKLTDNLRNMIFAGQTQLGTRGAGDSSAVNQMAYAYTKLGNQNQGDVLKQANQLHSQVDTQRTQLQNTVGDQLNQLNTWKNDQISQIAQYINQQKSSIEQNRGMGQVEKGQALAQLNAGFAQQAMARLSQIDAQYSNFQQGLQQWALQRAAQLDDYKMKLGQLGNYSPQQIVSQELPAANFGGGGGQQQSYTGLSANRRQVGTDQFGQPIYG